MTARFLPITKYCLFIRQAVQMARTLALIFAMETYCLFYLGQFLTDSYMMNLGHQLL